MNKPNYDKEEVKKILIDICSLVVKNEWEKELQNLNKTDAKTSILVRSIRKVHLIDCEYVPRIGFEGQYVTKSLNMIQRDEICKFCLPRLDSKKLVLIEQEKPMSSLTRTWSKLAAIESQIYIQSKLVVADRRRELIERVLNKLKVKGGQEHYKLIQGKPPKDSSLGQTKRSTGTQTDPEIELKNEK